MEFQITKETSSLEQNKKKTLMIVRYSDGLKQIRFTKALFYIQWIYDKVNIPVFITQSVYLGGVMVLGDPVFLCFELFIVFDFIIIYNNNVSWFLSLCSS